MTNNTDRGAFLFINGKNYFFIPYNVFVFGTMNVIDRSVESFDFALRRRFRWEELKVDLAAARNILSELQLDEALVKQAVSKLASLNEQISEHPYLGPDYVIGHAYVRHLGDYRGPGGAAAACEFLWHTRLEPLLKEYLRGMGNPERIRKTIDSFRKSFLG